MPAWAAVCALVDQIPGLTFEAAADTSLYWVGRWRVYRELTRPAANDPEAA